ncbi:hypothetical protein V6U81_12115 [Micromonospora sp. CPCC 205711]|uniref:hypothetical protein n=1 Tax=Micromonospora sp. CPCC 205547 TaxID=3122400 RepID=UPI002FF0029E
MEEVRQGGTVDILEYLHRRLDDHFRHLHETRQQLDPVTPVFVLEHDLGETELDLLKTTVRTAVAQGFGARVRQWWLPFVVYAAESGYDYVGDEYWLSFETSTPSWRTHGDRQRIKTWFMRFADEYGGAVPTGAFAQNFTIIAWPITHAVLPTYLQRQLAHLLYEFRTGLTTRLLGSPDALGAILASRTGGYTERFRIFCENATLLGQVAAALLSGDDEESPYLVRSTLHRLVEGLSRERQSRLWLTQAKQSASRVRASGFRSHSTGTASLQRKERLPAATDPKLLLRYQEGGWRAYAQLPDLTLLHGRLPHVYDELRRSRARIAGVDGKMLATGRLVYPGQEVRLTSWPRRETPFIQLERGSAPVNGLIADQCMMSAGPWWLFRQRDAGPAMEVKGKFARPGRSYVLVGDGVIEPPDVPWLTETTIHVDGVRAFDLSVPRAIGEADAAALVATGISVLADVAVRPIGMVASAWDGEGSVEWLAGEHAMIGLRAERAPEKCVLAVDGDLYSLAWPAQQPDLFVSLDGLTVGTHQVTATLLATGDQPLAEGSLLVTIRDPQVRPEGATSGEGIRLLASPARPSLTELWAQSASLFIAGPRNATAELSVTLRGADGEPVAKIHRRIDLPMNSAAWSKFAQREFSSADLQGSYDEAESCEIAVSKAGIGFASLVCDRGFRALRWVLVKRHRRRSARLVDRTDGDDTRIEFFPVESPLVGVSYEPGAEIQAPPRGGLLRATAGNVEASVILPPDPNELRAMGSARSSVEAAVSRTRHELMRLVQGHHNWLRADLPGDPFARYQQRNVLNAIARTLVSVIAGNHWARLERKLELGDVLDHLDEMRAMVGDSFSQKALAKDVAHHLWRWSGSRTSLLSGFAGAIASTAASSGIDDPHLAARFLLCLASSPGRLAEWNPTERDQLLDRVVNSPVLLRAARFVVLGTDAYREGTIKSSTGGVA